MIISNCPLRISLFGGSTDNPFFIEKYGYGSVISFTCNLKTYVSIHEDKIGYNKHLHKYIINYSKREEVDDISHIKNEVVKVVLEYFNIDPMTISLTSDCYSQGSGLASSSSYIISLIKAISINKKMNLTDSEICQLSFILEQKLNPYCGLQDPYGCGIGGFKRIEFQKNNKVKFNFLSTKLFEQYDFHLLFTGINRNSKNVLNNVSNNIDKIQKLLPFVDKAEDSILNENFELFIELVNESWETKKKTSNLILEDPKLQEIDLYLAQNSSVLSHKLCGAGNGGFFLLISHKNTLKCSYSCTKINICCSGIEGMFI